MARLQISENPLASIFGSQSAYQVLMYLEAYEKGYASEIARTFGISLNQVQNQLRKFEDAGLLVSRAEGTVRMYYMKRGPLADALSRFLRDILSMLPEQTVERHFRQRRRPRRFGKR